MKRQNQLLEKEEALNEAAYDLMLMANGDFHQELWCLQLIGRYIAEPWMDMVGREANILELNSQFKQAHETMTVWTHDAICLLTRAEKKNCFGF